MLDYIAYLTARQRTVDLARGARSDSPVRLDATVYRPGGATGRIRRAASDALRRLADRLDVAPAGRIDTADACR